MCHRVVLIGAAHVASAFMLAVGLLDASRAAEPTDPISEVDVTSQKQTALDAEAISISSTPDAEPSVKGKTSIVVGLGPAVAPVYDGSKDYKLSLFPYFDIHGLLHDRVYLSDVRGLGVNIVNSGPFRAGAAVNIEGGRTDRGSDRLRGLPYIGTSGVVEGFLSYSLKPFAFEGRVQRELGVNAGTQAGLAASFGAAPTPRLHLSVGAQLSWADSEFNQKHFGVTPAAAAQATAVGNPMGAYVPGSGLTNIGMSATGVYAWSEHWGLAVRLGVTDVIGTPAKDSPLTQRKVGGSLAIGPLYKF
jgi:outer membrane scaffolding protein for murein synthesis (MipA/OmpV family)